MKRKYSTKKQAKRRCPECPCGGGQSCIVMRRFYGDWVHEDDLLKEAKLVIRENCFTPWTEEQRRVMDNFHGNYDSATKSIITRWEIDGEQEENKK